MKVCHLHLNSKISISAVIHIINQFGRLSGFKINYTGSEAVFADNASRGTLTQQ